MKTAVVRRIRRGDIVMEVDPAFDPEPRYRCTHVVFDNNNVEKESPVAHLARFLTYLENTPRTFSVDCVATVTQDSETETFEEEECSIQEIEMAGIPEFLALKQPEILRFWNSAFTEPRITTIQMTGEVDISYTKELNAFEYVQDAVSNCYRARLAIPEDLRRRLALIFPSLVSVAEGR